MKTTLITLLTALLLVTAAVANGRLFDAGDFIAIAFATGLVAWTVIQYRSRPRGLTAAPCLHLPMKKPVPSAAPPASRCAA
jgi:hypothetical protein